MEENTIATTKRALSTSVLRLALSELEVQRDETELGRCKPTSSKAATTGAACYEEVGSDGLVTVY